MVVHKFLSVTFFVSLFALISISVKAVVDIRSTHNIFDATDRISYVLSLSDCDDLVKVEYHSGDGEDQDSSKAIISSPFSSSIEIKLCELEFCIK